MKLHANLTQEQASFAIWLEENAPYLLQLWDFEKKTYIIEKVENYLDICSPGQAIICRFSLSIWRGDNDYSFDLIQATKTLGDNELNVIRAWLANPVFP